MEKIKKLRLCNSPIGAVHGKIGFLFILFCIGHTAKRWKWVKKQNKSNDNGKYYKNLRKNIIKNITKRIKPHPHARFNISLEPITICDLKRVVTYY